MIVASKPARTRTSGVNTTNKTASHLISSEMFLEGKSIEEIAALREVNTTTIESHLLKAASEGIPLDFSSIVDTKTKEQINVAIEKVGLEGGLKPIKEALPEEISYFSIRANIHSLTS